MLFKQRETNFFAQQSWRMHGAVPNIDFYWLRNCFEQPPCMMHLLPDARFLYFSRSSAFSANGAPQTPQTNTPDTPDTPEHPRTPQISPQFFTSLEQASRYYYMAINNQCVVLHKRGPSDLFKNFPCISFSLFWAISRHPADFSTGSLVLGLPLFAPPYCLLIFAQK